MEQEMFLGIHEAKKTENVVVHHKRGIEMLLQRRQAFCRAMVAAPR